MSEAVDLEGRLELVEEAIAGRVTELGERLIEVRSQRDTARRSAAEWRDRAASLDAQVIGLTSQLESTEAELEQVRSTVDGAIATSAEAESRTMTAEAERDAAVLARSEARLEATRAQADCDARSMVEAELRAEVDRLRSAIAELTERLEGEVDAVV